MPRVLALRDKYRNSNEPAVVHAAIHTAFSKRQDPTHALASGAYLGHAFRQVIQTLDSRDTLQQKFSWP